MDAVDRRTGWKLAVAAGGCLVALSVTTVVPALAVLMFSLAAMLVAATSADRRTRPAVAVWSAFFAGSTAAAGVLALVEGIDLL